MSHGVHELEGSNPVKAIFFGFFFYTKIRTQHIPDTFSLPNITPTPETLGDIKKIPGWGRLEEVGGGWGRLGRLGGVRNCSNKGGLVGRFCWL